MPFPSRLLVAIACSWVAGLWLGLACPRAEASALAWLPLSLASVLTWRLARPSRVGAQAFALALVPCAAGAGWLAGSAPAPARPAPPPGLARIEGRVERSLVGADGESWASVRVLSGRRLRDNQALAPGTRLRVGPEPLPAGARVRLLARVKPIAPFRNPTPHPPWPRPDLDGLAFLPGPSAVQVLELGPIDRLVFRLRGSLRTALERTLPRSHAALARALLLGERRAVDPGTVAAVTDAGLAHVLAVSGLHIALLAGAGLWLLRRVLAHVRPLTQRVAADRMACALSAPCALLLALTCGAGPSALRAGATAAFGWGLRGLGLRPRGAPLAAMAALWLTLDAPGEASRVGLVLSVLATAAIVSAPATQLRAGGLRSAWFVTLRSTVATAPLVLWCFGTLPWIGLCTNLVGVPWFAALILPLAALHGALACVLPDAATATAWLFGLSADAWLGACRFAAAHTTGLTPPPLTLVQGATLAGACLLGLWPGIAWRTRGLGLLAGALIAVGAEWHVRHMEQPEGALRITFLDVAQGDAALVDLPDGSLMLIDAGGAPGGGPDPGERVLRPLLAARRRSRVDVAVLSHPHPDHYGGLSALRMPIGELWDSGQAEGEADLFPVHQPVVDLLAARRARGTRVLGPAALCGRPRAVGGARIHVLWPCPGYDPGLSPNDNSLVLRIDYGQVRVLFTGDVEASAEAALVARWGADALRADVLKVPHHGSRTSSGEAFLGRVAPRVAVISAGRFNRFGHPHGEVVQRLRAAGARVLPLAEVGGSVFETDGHHARLHSVAGPTLTWSSLGRP